LKTLIICGNPCLQNLYYSPFDISFVESSEVKRSQEFHQFLGGKGFNVAGFLSHQGVNNSVLFPLGKGMSADFIEQGIKKLSYSCFLNTPMETDNRVCTTTIHGGIVQEWISPYPQISNDEFQCFVDLMLGEIPAYDRVIVCGSIPSIHETIFLEMQTALLKWKDQGGELWLDQFQHPSHWIQNINGNQVWPSLWKLNLEEWICLNDILLEQLSQADSNYSAMIKITTAGDKDTVKIQGGQFQLGAEIELEINKLVAVNPIGAGDIWFGALIEKLDLSPLHDIQLPQMTNAVLYANEVAKSKVKTLNLWDFESYL
jgi:fructose-1-phosphate kinase PfkB-like protein